MAGGQPQVVSNHKPQAETGGLGDWIAPIIAFVVVSGMWLSVICVLLGPAQ